MTQPPQGSQYSQASGNYQQGGSNQSGQSYPNPFAQNIPPCPKDYLVQNIVFGILGMCGCIGLVTGIIGIVFSAQVKSKYNAGDFAGAASASNVAKIMFIINLVIAILAVLYWILSFVLAFLGIASMGLEDFIDMYSYYAVAMKLF